MRRPMTRLQRYRTTAVPSTGVRLAVDEGHVHADGGRPLRRDGEVLPLRGQVDPPIEVGPRVRRSRRRLGRSRLHPNYISATLAT